MIQQFLGVSTKGTRSYGSAYLIHELSMVPYPIPLSSISCNFCMHACIYRIFVTRHDPEKKRKKTGGKTCNQHTSIRCSGMRLKFAITLNLEHSFKCNFCYNLLKITNSLSLAYCLISLTDFVVFTKFQLITNSVFKKNDRVTSNVSFLLYNNMHTQLRENINL